jgi:PAS domain S-box-containing protein
VRERRNPASAKLARGRKIRQEELKEAAVIDAMGDGLVLVDTNGKITAVNPALEKLTGYSKDEFIGKDAVYLAKKLLNLKT